MYMQSLKLKYTLHDSIRTKKLIFYTGNEIKHGFSLLLIKRIFIFGDKRFSNGISC